jgi:hypothetical protein
MLEPAFQKERRPLRGGGQARAPVATLDGLRPSSPGRKPGVDPHIEILLTVWLSDLKRRFMAKNRIVISKLSARLESIHSLLSPFFAPCDIRNLRTGSRAKKT